MSGKLNSSFDLINKVFDGLIERKIISSVLILSEPLSICIDSWMDALESGSWGIIYDKAVIMKVGGRDPRLLVSAKGWGHSRGSPKVNKIVGFLDLNELSGVLSSKMSDETRVKVLSPIISGKLSDKKNKNLWCTERFCAGLRWLFYIGKEDDFHMYGRDISRFQSGGKWDISAGSYIAEQIERDLRDGVI